MIKLGGGSLIAHISDVVDIPIRSLFSATLNVGANWIFFPNHLLSLRQWNCYVLKSKWFPSCKIFCSSIACYLEKLLGL